MDNILGIGLPELIVITVIALLVLGPERLPGVMREGAKYIRMIRGLSKELTDQFRDELDLLDELNPKRIFDEATDPDYEKKQAAKKAKQSSSKPQPTTSSTAKKSTVKKSTVKKPAVKKTEKPALGSEPVAKETVSTDASAAEETPSPESVDVEGTKMSEDESVQDDAVENSIASPEMLIEKEEAQPVAMHTNGTASVAGDDRDHSRDRDHHNDE